MIFLLFQWIFLVLRGLCQVFSALDRDASGTISIQELFQLLKAADPEESKHF